MKKKTTITLQMKEEDRYSLEPQKAQLTGEFGIVAKFGGHALRIWSGREAGRERSLVLVIFLKIRI